MRGYARGPKYGLSLRACIYKFGHKHYGFSNDTQRRDYNDMFDGDTRIT